MSIGENIKKIRKEKGLTQKELGKLINVSESQIGSYENGYRNPKIVTIRKISKALDVYMGEIIDDWDLIPDEDLKKDFEKSIELENKKFYKELDKRQITLIYELIGKIFKETGKYPINLNDANGLNIFLNKNLTEYKTLTNEELKKIEDDILTYLDFLLEKALKDKEVIKLR